MRKVLLAVVIAILVTGAPIVIGPFDREDRGDAEPGPQATVDGELPELENAGELSTNDLADGEPPELRSDKPSLATVEELSTKGLDIGAGEQFAANLVQLLTDSRQPLDIEKLIEELTPDDLATSVETFFLENLAAEYDREFGRHWVTSEGAWIRTNQGPDGGLQIEIAFHEATKVFPDYIRWPVVRIDVAHDGEAWKLLDLTTRQIDPFNKPELAEVLELHLDGEGWREIEPIA